jgi:hypothetical protein
MMARAVEIAVIVAAVDDDQVAAQPWVYGQAELQAAGIDVRVFRGRAIRDAFGRPFDAMLLHVWQDWMNPGRFNPLKIMPVIERAAAYRLRYPQTIQIVLNHTDDSRGSRCLPYWRPGDPILYRTPPYDRAELAPLPAHDIWAYEFVWGRPRFTTDRPPRFAAGFIGTPTGVPGYRARVARATSKVGIGLCHDRNWLRWRRLLPGRMHDWLMSRCRIIVCPRGWGPQSSRHWDAWRSGKPVLTDRECATVELIPGSRLVSGEHYLVFDDPADIPDIVNDWTRPSRLDDLAAIAENGRRAALSYDAVGRIREFFRTLLQRSAN